MAGSLTWFGYEDDLDNIYAVKMDESNAESIAGTGGDSLMLPFADITVPLTELPRGIKMRYVLGFFENSPKIRRKYYIGRKAVLEGLLQGGNILSQSYPADADGANINAESFIVTSYRGETRRIISAVDTGLIDGDGAGGIQ